MIATATQKILVNSSAGALKKTAGAEEMRAEIARLGVDAEVIETHSPEEMEAMIDRLVASGVERVAVSGGDGTVSRAVQRLVHTNTALAILPQGTANNFATALRLPMDLASALKVLEDGVVREVDLGVACGRYFTEAAGVGLFADILAVYGAKTNKSFFRGLYAMLRVFCSMRSRRLRLEIDGTLFKERAVMCTFANSFRMAEGIAVAPQASLSDGRLDVVVIGDLRRGELLRYYRAFRAQTQMGLPKVSSMRATTVSIDWPRAMNVHVDDHVAGMTPVTVKIEPHALRVMVERP